MVHTGARYFSEKREGKENEKKEEGEEKERKERGGEISLRSLACNLEHFGCVYVVVGHPKVTIDGRIQPKNVSVLVLAGLTINIYCSRKLFSPAFDIKHINCADSHQLFIFSLIEFDCNSDEYGFIM